MLVSHDFLEVITCGRVGRIENGDFVASAPPAPKAMTFATQCLAPPEHRRRRPRVGPSGGRVVLAFESSEAVGVMVTSSRPPVVRDVDLPLHRCPRPLGVPAAAPAIGTPLARAAAAEAAEAADGVDRPPLRRRGLAARFRNLGTPRALGMSGRGSRRPWGRAARRRRRAAHSISGGQFSRTVDFVSLGAHGLVEFVQLGIMHEPQ